MSFFQSIADLKLNGDLQISIRQDGAGSLAVMIHMTNHKAKEGGLNIPVIKMSGTPAAIDEGFFAKLSQPVADAINTNIDDFLSQLQANKAAGLSKTPASSTTATKAAALAKPEPTAAELRKKKFEKIMADIDTLVGEKKFKEATAKLPKITDWPEFTWEITQKKTDINRAATAPIELFAGSPTSAPPALATGPETEK